MSRPLLILLIVLLSIFGPISTDMYLSGLPDMVIEFGTTESVMNMSLYLFMLSFTISILLLGPVSDKYGRKKVLITSMVVYTASCLLCCLSPNVETFIALRMIEAIGAGGAITIAFALVKDCFSGREMSGILSMVAVLGILGPILAPVIGTVLINLIDWKATFWAPGIVALFCIALGTMIPGDIPVERMEGKVTEAVKCVFRLMKERSFFDFTIMNTTCSGSQLAFIAVSSYVFLNDYGLDRTGYSIALAVSCVIGLVLAEIIKHTGLNGRSISKILFGLSIASFVMMLLLPKYGWIWFMLSITPNAAACTVTRSCGFNILMNNHEGDNGAVSSLLNFMTFLFAFIGMAIASSFPSDGFVLGIAVVMLLMTLTYAICWFDLKRRTPLKGME